MDIALNIPVYCAEGHCGHVSNLILHAKNRQIKSIVVKGKAAPHREWIVPISDITSATPDNINLSYSLSELRTKRPFRVAEHIASNLPIANSGHMVWSGGSHEPTQRRYISVEHKDLNVGELALSINARVRATNGSIGRVREFLVDAQSGSITHIVLKKGHLWGQREVLIPIDDVDEVRDDVVLLKLSKREVEALPVRPVSGSA